MTEDQHLFFLGGISSGKSACALAWAETRAKERLFLAPCRVQDAETARRVARHKKERGADWSLLEEPVELCACVERLLASPSSPGLLLLDALSSWIANLLEDGASEETVLKESEHLAALLATAPFPTAVVSLETGLGIVPMEPLSRRFSDLLGKSNQLFASYFSTVLFVSCGLPLALKGTVPVSCTPSHARLRREE